MCAAMWCTAFSLCVGKPGSTFCCIFCFFFPGILALFWYGWEIASDSWRYKEVSWNSPARIQIYFFKTLIPLAGALLLVQGVAELIRCWTAMKTGQWMERLSDVRETEDMLMDSDDLTIPSPLSGGEPSSRGSH